MCGMNRYVHAVTKEREKRKDKADPISKCNLGMQRKLRPFFCSALQAGPEEHIHLRTQDIATYDGILN